MGNKEFLGLRTVIYKVEDLQKAKQWYTEILDQPPYFAEPFYVGFNVAGYELGLQPEGTKLSFTTNEVVYWGVKDIQRSYDRLLELGATSFEEPEKVGGDIMTATVKDPWGNVFGIIYNPHFSLKN